MIPAAKFHKVVFGRVFIAAVLIVTFLMLAPTSGFAQTRRAVLAGINHLRSRRHDGEENRPDRESGSGRARKLDESRRLAE